MQTDIEGFDFCSKLLEETCDKKTYIFDFKDVEWIEANLCAILGAIIIHNKKKGAKFEFINLNNTYLNQVIKNNGFLELIKGVKQTKYRNSSIPFREFNMTNENEVEEYIYGNVLLSSKVPKMSEGAKKKIYRSIFEIYQNSLMHSGADKIYVCGQFYNYKERMALTMVEIGNTFKYNVVNHKDKFKLFTGKESIEWAVESGNTTKQEGEPGGLGLDLIRDFLRKNGGKLQIKSDDGYWEEKKGIIFASDSLNPFQGSIVNIEFNLFDKQSYTTAEEINIKDIL